MNFKNINNEYINNEYINNKQNNEIKIKLFVYNEHLVKQDL